MKNTDIINKTAHATFLPLHTSAI